MLGFFCQKKPKKASVELWIKHTDNIFKLLLNDFKIKKKLLKQLVKVSVVVQSGVLCTPCCCSVILQCWLRGQSHFQPGSPVQLGREVQPFHPQQFCRLLMLTPAPFPWPGTNTVWKWFTSPPMIPPKTSSGSLPLILRLGNAGATTDSSGWTCWPTRATWTGRTTPSSSGGAPAAACVLFNFIAVLELVFKLWNLILME